MQVSRSSFFAKAAAVALGLAGLAATGAAQARDNVNWSVGINLGQPVYVQPQPVYVQPQPVYVQPQTIYSVPQVQYVQPQVIYPAGAYVQPVVVQRVPIYRGGHHHGHGHGRHWR